MNSKTYRISTNEFLTPKWSVVYIFECSPKETLLHSNWFDHNNINETLCRTGGRDSQISRDYYNRLIESLSNETNTIQNR